MFSSRPALASVSLYRRLQFLSVNGFSFFMWIASVSLDSLDGVWLSGRSLLNNSSPYKSLNTILASSRSHYPKVAASRWMPQVLLWSSQVLQCTKRLRPLRLKEVVSHKLGNNSPTMKRPILSQIWIGVWILSSVDWAILLLTFWGRITLR